MGKGTDGEDNPAGLEPDLARGFDNDLARMDVGAGNGRRDRGGKA